MEFDITFHIIVEPFQGIGVDSDFDPCHDRTVENREVGREIRLCPESQRDKAEINKEDKIKGAHQKKFRDQK
jgi:hypothetical protein